MLQRLNLIISSAAFIGFVSFLLLGMKTDGGSRIAYIETQRLLANYPPLVKLSKELKTKNEGYQAEINELLQSIQTDLQDFEKKRVKLSDVQIAEEEKKLQARRAEIESASEEIKKQAQQNNLSEMEGLTKEINDMIKLYGLEHDYDLIVAANGTGNLAYADKGIDITDDVIAYFTESN